MLFSLKKRQLNRKILYDNLYQKSEFCESRAFDLYNHSTDLLINRLLDIKQKFANIALFGIQKGEIKDKLRQLYPNSPITSIDIIASDKVDMVCNEEELKIEDDKFDLIISHMHLHELNAPHLFLKKAQSLLDQGGVFVGVLVGEDSLTQLRKQLMMIDNMYHGGGGARLIPMIELQSLSLIMQKVGFGLITCDSQDIDFGYNSMSQICKIIKLLGQGNIFAQNSPIFSKTAYKIMQEQGDYKDKLQLLFAIGWK